jgi:hypothetical protein
MCPGDRDIAYRLSLTEGRDFQRLGSGPSGLYPVFKPATLPDFHAGVCNSLWQSASREDSAPALAREVVIRPLTNRLETRGLSTIQVSTRGISSMWRASSSPERRRSTSPNIILAPANVTSTRSGRSMVSGPAILRHPASCSKRSLAWCDPRLNPRSSSGAVSMFWFVKRLKCQVTRG